ncbi:MAG: hypothetical protein GY821_13710 [Gammaproteobacteria bacterium]|nr:hypothetical protein [Gammaproteobacteria bacterium]
MNIVYEIFNDRLETIHAFLACLRSYENKEKISHGHTRMGFDDNFIICQRNESLEDLIYKNDGIFSSNEYKFLCRKKINKLKNKKPDIELNEKEIYEKSLEELDTIIDKKSKAVYYLAMLYRASTYYHSGLLIHAVIFLKLAFEWLVKEHGKLDDHNGHPYGRFLNYYSAKELEKDMLDKLKELRDSALHDMNYPKMDFSISKAFRFIEKCFNRMFSVDINIPFGTGITLFYGNCSHPF